MTDELVQELSTEEIELLVMSQLGSLKRDPPTSDEDLERIREDVGRELAKEWGIDLE